MFVYPTWVVVLWTELQPGNASGFVIIVVTVVKNWTRDFFLNFSVIVVAVVKKLNKGFVYCRVLFAYCECCEKSCHHFGDWDIIAFGLMCWKYLAFTCIRHEILPFGSFTLSLFLFCWQNGGVACVLSWCSGILNVWFVLRWPLAL